MKEQVLSSPHLILILTAIIGGTAARLLVLREDFRQYPTYPNGYLSHAVIGFVAATLGAVFVPALMTNNLTSVTFLTLALTQFQGVRKLEQTSLQLMEETEYTKRGNAYIDGISKTFEARNYIALLVALIIGVIMEALEGSQEPLRITVGIAGGVVVFYFLKHFSKGKVISSIASVAAGEISIKNNELFVDDIFVSNRIGIKRGQEMLLEEGLAVVVTPHSDHYRIALDNYGQRQAILFEITRSLGIKRYHFTRKDYVDGRIVFVVVPIIQNIKRMITSVENTPLLESTQKKHKFIKEWADDNE
ncbi:YIEGIA protein [Falsibacillus albus]|uniref:YIEGIA protein n=1 Tax=Falsibacillus albus TaxID=2478915 RepID=A0A3L7JNS7_9BACI|nr:YIEGIA protein [Falsibacillus albus]